MCVCVCVCCVFERKEKVGNGIYPLTIENLMYNNVGRKCLGMSLILAFTNEW